MPLTYSVDGQLRGSGAHASMLIRKHTEVSPTLDERSYWEQRPMTPSAKHLARHYVCGETFQEIMDGWLACDWKFFNVAKIDEE